MMLVSAQLSDSEEDGKCDALQFSSGYSVTVDKYFHEYCVGHLQMIILSWVCVVAMPCLLYVLLIMSSLIVAISENT